MTAGEPDGFANRIKPVSARVSGVLAGDFSQTGCVGVRRRRKVRLTTTILGTSPHLHYIDPAGAGLDRRASAEESSLTYHAPAAAAASPTGAFAPLPEATDSSDLLSTILASLDDDKAEDVLSIPLSGKSEMSDHMVIASGRSSRQVSAIAEKLADRLKQEMGLLVRIEGKDLGDWVLIDAGDVIVHVFRPEVRDFYQLEKMWQPQAPRPRAADTV